MSQQRRRRHRRFSQAATVLAAVILSGLPGCAIRRDAGSERELAARPLPTIQWPERIDLAHPTFGAKSASEELPHPESGPTDLRLTELGEYCGGKLWEMTSESIGPDRRFMFASLVRMPAMRDPKGIEQVELNMLRKTPMRLVLAGGERSRGEMGRGVLVHLSSLGGGTKYERKVIDAFADDGWTVIECHPRLDLLRSFVGIEMKLNDEKSCREFARLVAAAGDSVIAERAYAVEALLSYLVDEGLAAADADIVLTGYSAGAITLPGVAARLNGRVDAAVLVVGGANMFSMFDRSSLFGFGDAVRRSKSKEFKQIYAKIPQWYIESAQLDPANAAVFLDEVPVLMIRAMFDRVVPSDSGDLLYERLRKPECWGYPLGHSLLFWRLPGIADDLVRWVDDAVEAR